MSNAENTGAAEPAASPVGSAVPVRSGHPGHFLSHYPLRISLVVVIAVLVAMGLTVSGVSVTTTLQRFLIQRVDEQLDQATNGWAHRSGLAEGNSEDQSAPSGSDSTALGLEGFGVLNLQQPPNPVTGVTRPPSDFYILVVDDQVSYEYFNSPLKARPEIRGLGQPTMPVTVGSREDSGTHISWRATSFRNDDGTITIVALPLAEEEHIISRLVLLQACLLYTSDAADE